MTCIDRRLGVLIFCVVVAHLILFFSNFSQKKQALPKKPFVVNTHYLQPNPQPLKPRVNQEKRAVKTQNIAQKRSPVKKLSSSPLQKRAMLKEMKKALIKLEHRGERIEKSTLLLPKPIDMLQVDCAEEEQEETDYFVALISLLKEKLELPEWGRVKLELTLFNTGKVQTIRVLQTESERNKRYLEQQLISLPFPSFTEELRKEKNHSFLFVFCNEK